MSKRLRFVNQFHFTDQDFSVGWHFDTGHFSDFWCRLANDSGVQATVFQDDVLNGFQLFALQHVATVGSEACAHCIVCGIDYDHGLFRRTDHTAVEGF
ncbi:hypothetical protein D3C79_718750 [compost metagenome]